MLVVGVRLRHLCHKYVEGHEEPPMPDYLQLPCTNYLFSTEVSRSMPTADTEKDRADPRVPERRASPRPRLRSDLSLGVPRRDAPKKVARSKLP